jgi:hypothetical protein
MLEACARRNRRHDVSVDRSGAGGIRPQFEDPADGGCADVVAELEEFALDALVAPGLVPSGHPFDQRGDRRVEGWATGAVRVGPLLRDQGLVPRRMVAG